MRYSKLSPGEDTADTTQPKKRKDGKYQGTFTLCLPNGKPIKVKVIAPTVGQWRKKAREKVEERLQNEERAGDWTGSELISAYIHDVSLNAIEASNLRTRTKDKYLYLLRILAKEFDGITIREAVRFRNLEKALKNIAQAHGSESARQARNVLSKWILNQLIRDEVITGNPLIGMSIDLGENKKTAKTKGGRGLTENEHARVLDYLLSINIENVAPPKRGRYTTQDRANMRKSIIDLTLLQATTGLRISEALGLRLDEIKDSGQEISITISDERSKTHRGRTVPIMLDTRVTERIRERIAQTKGELLFPAPAQAGKEWNDSNARKGIRALFDEMAEECSIPLLHEISSHSWRTTLNTIAMNKGVPAEIRAAYFGHSAPINKTAYTDSTDISPLVKAMTK